MTERAADQTQPTGHQPVEFRMSADHLDANTVHLVGEFNDWSSTSTPMRRVGTEFVVTVSLTAGRTYRYKYLVDGQRWENDWHADAYVPNEFGGDDSLLDLTAPAASRETVDPDSPGGAIDQLQGDIPEPNEPA